MNKERKKRKVVCEEIEIDELGRTLLILKKI